MGPAAHPQDDVDAVALGGVPEFRLHPRLEIAATPQFFHVARHAGVKRIAVEAGAGLDAELSNGRAGVPSGAPSIAALRTRACGPAATSNVSVV